MQEAYRGYLIRTLLSGSITVSRDGFHICYANSVDDAKREIDGLVG